MSPDNFVHPQTGRIFRANPWHFYDWCPHDPVQACRKCVLEQLWAADERGDGPMVNAICAYGRARFGEGLYW